MKNIFPLEGPIPIVKGAEQSIQLIIAVQIINITITLEMYFLPIPWLGSSEDSIKNIISTPPMKIKKNVNGYQGDPLCK